MSDHTGHRVQSSSLELSILGTLGDIYQRCKYRKENKELKYRLTELFRIFMGSTMAKTLKQMLEEQPEHIVVAAGEKASLILAELDKGKQTEEAGKMDRRDEN